ncbi:DM13 domain-containing protein [Thalassotalea sp. M1531]|uniref:DM13 domain-containing protein n=1 Tax=Thalassotalea algicola TaxID=2716224 RepID=A0A7Y0L913_9GAMM|nr:DM13 domain-containing protein [Thalassotalea algicola]NMP30056.1 DM13 domain-containing protein [Thalassotalea algicola]
MSFKTIFSLTVTHLLVGVIGFGLGIYALPILTAPPAPQANELSVLSKSAVFTAEFTKDLKGSDALHWGEGEVAIGDDHISLLGSLAPGPDYKLYLSPTFVETEAEFKRLKHTMKMVGNVNTFDNFIVKYSESIDLQQFNTVVVWCESFGEFITSAKYR